MNYKGIIFALAVLATVSVSSVAEARHHHCRSGSNVASGAIGFALGLGLGLIASPPRQTTVYAAPPAETVVIDNYYAPAPRYVERVYYPQPVQRVYYRSYAPVYEQRVVHYYY